jgi:hypothetical protein
MSDKEQAEHNLLYSKYIKHPQCPEKQEHFFSNTLGNNIQ